ncbi:WD repeat protein [Colletotrichum karsti]|uniref:WD repeat protein n=1 Tax=Colletotrichum karsti TaxID=1095194 RepID=A0A9P6LND8_9PEZI|nr:WD repeat protein [Colletotrichum karsti]KAF9879091.1 WD repeat protein [Colletotrichum karsti]
MRPRTSETAAQPSQAQATSATSNHHPLFAGVPPPIDAPPHDHQPHREPGQHDHAQEPPAQGPAYDQHAYMNTGPVHYQPNFPVAPPSYYHDSSAFLHDQYGDYEDYEDYDDDEDDDEDMDMSDSDGGVPLGNVMPATSVLSPGPDAEPVSSHPEDHPGSPHPEDFTHAAYENHLSPTAPPAHMTSYWSVSVFDPTGPFHPTPLNTIPFHPMLNGGGVEDDDDDDFLEPTNPVVISSLAGEFQQHGAMAIDEEEAAAWQDEGPPAVSNPNPSTLGPENHCLKEFLKEWAWRNRGARYQLRGPSPGIQSITAQAAKKIPRVQYSDLEGDECDIQGINWEDLGVTRSKARERRRLMYKNYTNRTGSDKWQNDFPDRAAWNVEDFFRFRRMHIRQNVHLAHFQLRNILACAGRSRAFYPGQRAIHQLNPVSGHSEVAMDLTDLGGVQISTLDANCGVLIAGTFNGEYCMRNIHSQDKKYTEGQITNHISGITNHLQIHESRNSSAMAAFASNDQGFRVMDVATEKFVMETQYPCPINCSALSADRRLRVMVGDNYDVMIANADTGEILRELDGHRDFGFACDWSDDGWTVATGFQDMSVKIWDARMWTKSDGSSKPLATIRSEMAGVRSLRFSPTGSGPPVLVAAEEADFVNIINVQTLRHKQTFDIFGEIGGVEFSNDGQDLNVLCMDRTRGGLVQLERHDMGSWEFESANQQTSRDAWWRTKRGATDDESSKRPTSPIQWERKVSVFDDLEPF